MASLFLIFLRLGCTSFGGPVAHIAYFQETFVQEKKWLTDHQFAQYNALCQLLPGPASSQLGFLIGLHRAGWLGALAAWLGFTLPSSLILASVAYWGIDHHSSMVQSVLHGFKLVAVIVVAQAVVWMWQSHCRTPFTRMLSVMSLGLCLFYPSATTQILVIGLAGLAGWSGFDRWLSMQTVFRGQSVAPNKAIHQTVPDSSAVSARVRISKGGAWVLLVWVIGLALWSILWPDLLFKQTVVQPFWELFQACFRSGALVFGGGHVVLPLLERAVVDTGMVTQADFIAGYGLTQAMPGPLFTVATWIGMTSQTNAPWLAAIVATLAIFLPGLLLAVAGLALWGQVNQHPKALWVLIGIHAAVVGLLAATWVSPLVLTALTNWVDVVLVTVLGALRATRVLKSWQLIVLAPVGVLLAGLLGLI